MKIYKVLNELISYAKRHLALCERDVMYIQNEILDVLHLGCWKESECETVDDIDALLKEFVSVAVEEKIFEREDGAYYTDKIMGILSLSPSGVDEAFAKVLAEKGSRDATEWLYEYSVANNYVKKAVLDKNPRFDRNGLVITINLAKPEFRDPNKAKSGNSVAGGYPKCVICRENEGLASRNKCTLRTVSLNLDGKPWFWQFSPYGYFYQHGIAVNCEHTPMKIDRQTFVNLLDFVDQFPHYFIGCNATLERIGGSVLAHDHYQGGGEVLPMHNAKIRVPLTLDGFDDLNFGILDWPGTVVRVSGKDKAKIIDACDKIRIAWKDFTDESQELVCRSERGQHHSVSPTVVKRGDTYEVSVILRSNLTSEKYPDGIYHAHPEFHIIKKESIGLIEAQGLFILPGRLEKQLKELEECVKNGSLTDDLSDFEFIYNEVKVIYDSGVEASEAVKEELGSVCYRILQNTAVFANDDLFLNFLHEIGFNKA